jgi:hypothetical protein
VHCRAGFPHESSAASLQGFTSADMKETSPERPGRRADADDEL